uniref:Uncharacterized protein n=1 Tax=Panagrellus redivivus TaxID=6233 RepID=A0A7E4WCJ4_PANRE
MPVRVLHMKNVLAKLPIFPTRFRCFRTSVDVVAILKPPYRIAVMKPCGQRWVIAAFSNCRYRDLAAISSMMVHSLVLKLNFVPTVTFLQF